MAEHAIKYTCRGKLPEGVQAHIDELLAADKGDEASRIDVVNRGLKAANLTGMVKQEGLDDEGNIVEVENPAPRGPGCGYDLTEMIEDCAFDGMQRARKCPQCESVFNIKRMPRDGDTNG